MERFYLSRELTGKILDIQVDLATQSGIYDKLGFLGKLFRVNSPLWKLTGLLYFPSEHGHFHKKPLRCFQEEFGEEVIATISSLARRTQYEGENQLVISRNKNLESKFITDFDSYLNLDEYQNQQKLTEIHSSLYEEFSQYLRRYGRQEKIFWGRLYMDNEGDIKVIEIPPKEEEEKRITDMLKNP